jgi:hypothetical protein
MLFSASVTPSGKVEGAGGRAVRQRHASGSASASNPNETANAASVFVCAAGDIHGAIGRFYDDVLAFQTRLGVRFDWVLHVGDFGIWPDPQKIDRGTRYRDGVDRDTRGELLRRGVQSTVVVRSSRATSLG